MAASPSSSASAGPGLSPVLAYAPAALAAALALWFASFIPAVMAEGSVRAVWPWIPSMGVSLSFLIDGLSLTFALMISGIGAVVFLYTPAYFGGKPGLGRMLGLLFAFMLSMLGVVLADNLVALFVFWEGTTIISFLLIGYTHKEKKARDSALQALIVTGAGGLALLAGLLLLGQVGGTFEISELAGQASDIKAHPLYLGILFCFLLGAFTKSAQFPFHFWLPGAMAAPTPVSAYLHSATMVKAGVYLLARMSPTLGGTEVWMWTLTIFGAITAVLSSIWAMRQTDLKLMLAYTTVMGLGTLTMFLGSSAEVAIVAAATFLIVHALYKAALFLVIGIIDHEAGTREHGRLAGLAKAMPITAAIAALAALSMSGIPPFLGFIGKELQYEGALAVASSPLFVAAAAVTANALMVAVALICAYKPFYGGPVTAPGKPHDPPLTMWIGPALLAAMALIFGVAPGLVGPSLVIPAAESIAGTEIDKYLALWHGINLPLMMSVLTVALGLLFYWQRQRIADALERFEIRAPKASAEHGYDLFLKGLKGLAAWQSDLLQGGRLQTYARLTLGVLAAVIWVAVLAGGGVTLEGHSLPSIMEAGLVLLGAGAIILTILTYSRLTAICALGVVGVIVAVIFVLYGAVDVAMTQLLVETLVVVLAALALRRLPRLRDPDSGSAPKNIRWGDAAVSGALGLGVTVTLIGVSAIPPDRRLTDFFEIASYPEAFGRNIVNVILVDFRALDTLGEIAVVVIAALGAFAVLKMKPERRKTATTGSEGGK